MFGRILRTSAALVVVALGACTTAYTPFAVEPNPVPAAQFDRLPAVLATPIEAAAGYRIYRAALGTDLYVTPTALELDRGRVRAEAINFERHDGRHLVLLVWVRPRDFDIQQIAEAHPGVRVRAYPVDRLIIRTITQVEDTRVMRVTVGPQPATVTPFGVLLAVQVFGRQTIKDMKALLAEPAGLLLEARFVMETSDQGQKEMVVPVMIGSVNLTEQTL